MRTIKQKTRDEKYYWKGYAKGYEKGFADILKMMKELADFTSKPSKLTK